MNAKHWQTGIEPCKLGQGVRSLQFSLLNVFLFAGNFVYVVACLFLLFIGFFEQKIGLQLTAQLENVTDLKACDEDFRWYLKVIAEML